jgi:hypothetical protein
MQPTAHGIAGALRLMPDVSQRVLHNWHITERSMRVHHLVAVSAVIALGTTVACSRTFPAPTADQVKQDLVGKVFSIPRGAMESSGWKVEPGGIESLDIQTRLTDKDSKTDELHATVSLIDSYNRYRGELIIAYRQFEQGWQLQSVRAGTKAFSVESLKTP